MKAIKNILLADTYAFCKYRYFDLEFLSLLLSLFI